MPLNAIQVLQMTDRSNCRECGFQTCLAFAQAVARSQTHLSGCTRLAPGSLEKAPPLPEKKPIPRADGDEAVKLLQAEIRKIDLAEAAKRIGAHLDRGKLILKVMGKDFSVDQGGNLYSDIHVHPWIAAPFLHYVLHAAGSKPTGKWVGFRELPGGGPMLGLYERRCEKPLQRVAETYTELFEDLMRLFNGQEVGSQFNADISLILRPLPLVPVLVCYWKPEEGIPATLRLFFDETAERNLGTEALYSLVAGLVQMFEKISHRHGV
ncbi:MAG: DUF3786 domain-containing protein [Thermodesulfobacteriota bacterium]